MRQRTTDIGNAAGMAWFHDGTQLIKSRSFEFVASNFCVIRFRT